MQMCTFLFKAILVCLNTSHGIF